MLRPVTRRRSAGPSRTPTAEGVAAGRPRRRGFGSASRRSLRSSAGTSVRCRSAHGAPDRGDRCRARAQRRWQGGELDRLLDRAHAEIVERVARRLTSLGWDVHVESRLPGTANVARSTSWDGTQAREPRSSSRSRASHRRRGHAAPARREGAPCATHRVRAPRRAARTGRPAPCPARHVDHEAAAGRARGDLRPSLPGTGPDGIPLARPS